jgi:hypothetical protein
MREIKFRWLHKKSNKIAGWDTMLKECDRLSMLLPSEDWIPMQYTGLKDCKGKEIYESDIVKFSCIDFAAKAKIIFRDGAFREDFYGYTLPKSDYMEVIGNEFENKEG